MRQLIGVAFGPRTHAEARETLPRIAAEGADLVEIRLDSLEEPLDLPALLAARGDLPVVATLRPRDQGGRSELDAGERLKVLLRAAEHGAQFVDVEWDAATPEAVAALKAAGARVIVSRHDFAGMPPGLADEWWPDLARRGADVVKVVGTARGMLDCLPVFRVLKQADRPTIAIAMGEAGIPTRILGLREEQCLLSYASLGEATAPGQVPLHDMQQVYFARRLRPETCAFGLLAERLETGPAAQFNALFAECGMEGVAVPFLAQGDVAAVVEAFRELEMTGWHVYGGDLQQSVLSAVDQLDPSARVQARVNAVVRVEDGSLVGAWVGTPEEQFALWSERASGRQA